jgi:hypothetical protein
MKSYVLVFCFSVFLIAACRLPDMSDKYKPSLVSASFDTTPKPPAPDYTNNYHWAALPWQGDGADLTPNGLSNNQSTAQVDVFFIYPTIFLEKPVDAFRWNAALENADLNKRIDESTLKFQASVFNGSCKIYSPKYRQAHISAYFTNNKTDGQQALDLAYEDVKQAFNYYLKKWNQGRPFIIAGHSQGTHHAGRLIKEMIEGTELEKQLVCAYLIGMPVSPKYFNRLKLCQKPSDTDCFCTWNTFAKNYLPRDMEKRGLDQALAINPLTFDVEKPKASKKENKGGLSWKFEKVIPHINDAEVHQGLLWVSKPKVPGRIFIKAKNYHVADYNLFYINLRENIQLRTTAFLKGRKK